MAFPSSCDPKLVRNVFEAAKMELAKPICKKRGWGGGGGGGGFLPPSGFWGVFPPVFRAFSGDFFSRGRAKNPPPPPPPPVIEL